MGGAGLGRGVRPGRREARDHHHRARAQRGGDLRRQPQRALARVPHPRGAVHEDPAHPQPVQRHDGRPAAAPVRGLAALRPPAAAADPGPRPHRLLPGPRRQPDGLQRLADDGPGLPAAGSRPQGPRRPDGRARPATDRDRQGGHRAPLRPARLRRGGAAGDAARPLRGGAHHSSGVRRPRRRGAGAGRAVHPRERRAGQRDRRGRDPAADPRLRGRRRRCGVRPDGRVDAGVRLGLPVGDPAAEPADRELRPGGRGAAARAGDRRGQARARRPGPPRRVAQPGPRRAGVRRRAPRLGDARGDRDARRGADPGDGDGRREPGAVHPRRRRAGPGLGRPRLHGLRRHLPQRDHPARRRDPAADVCPGARPLRPDLPRLRRPQHRAVHPGGLRPPGRRPPRLGDLRGARRAGDRTARRRAQGPAGHQGAVRSRHRRR